MTDGPLHYACEIAPDDPRRAARAAIRQRAMAPNFWVPVAVFVGFGAAMLSRLTWLAVVLLVVAGLSVVALLTRAPKLARQLAARGLRPGTTVTADYDDTALTVTSPSGRSVHRYASVRDVRVADGIAALRFHRRGVLVLLPAALVPGEAVRRLQAG
ncbi:hypothetical protein [Jatrophihabitans fulvus]